MSEKLRTTVEEAKRVGDEIGVDWSRFDLAPLAASARDDAPWALIRVEPSGR